MSAFAVSAHANFFKTTGADGLNRDLSSAVECLTKLSYAPLLKSGRKPFPPSAKQLGVSQPAE